MRPSSAIHCCDSQTKVYVSKKSAGICNDKVALFIRCVVLFLVALYTNLKIMNHVRSTCVWNRFMITKNKLRKKMRESNWVEVGGEENSSYVEVKARTKEATYCV